MGMGEQLNQEPSGNYQGVSEPNAASGVSSWREDTRKRERDVAYLDCGIGEDTP